MFLVITKESVLFAYFGQNNPFIKFCDTLYRHLYDKESYNGYVEHSKILLYVGKRKEKQQRRVAWSTVKANDD